MTDLQKSSGVPEAYSDSWVRLVKNLVARQATDDELALFLYQCKKTGLDPLAKQIYCQHRKDHKTGKFNMSILTGIDGYRLTAHRTGAYAGSDDYAFDDEENPRKATVTVYKIVSGIRCAFSASARWDQYYPGDAQGFMWRKMAHLMLGKCAEALALRKAFPQELSGLYVAEEMHQAGEPVQAEIVDDQKKPGPAQRYLKQQEEFKHEFGSNPDVVYTKTDQQKRELWGIAKKHGIEHPVHLGILSEALNENTVYMHHLDAAVKEWLEEHRGELDNPKEAPKSPPTPLRREAARPEG